METGSMPDGPSGPRGVFWSVKTDHTVKGITDRLYRIAARFSNASGHFQGLNGWFSSGSFAFSFNGISRQGQKRATEVDPDDSCGPTAKSAQGCGGAFRVLNYTKIRHARIHGNHFDLGSKGLARLEGPDAEF
jgi:hypothetical protein